MMGKLCACIYTGICTVKSCRCERINPAARKRKKKGEMAEKISNINRVGQSPALRDSQKDTKRNNEQ